MGELSSRHRDTVSIIHFTFLIKENCPNDDDDAIDEDIDDSIDGFLTNRPGCWSPFVYISFGLSRLNINIFIVSSFHSNGDTVRHFLSSFYILLIFLRNIF